MCALLSRDDVRLVTLTGAGGSGKTRLALAVAQALLDHFPDGVFFVDLAPIRDPSLVASAIGRALDVRETAGQPYLQALQDALREKSPLLLLDNFEQVLDAAPTLAELLAGAPTVKLLVTSREVLRLRAEHVFPVEPLAVSPLDALPPVEGIDGYSAVELFAQRASDARPDFRLTAENAAAVAEICACLDGLPLAIELAAARVRLLSPSALLSRLGKGLALAGSGARDLPARQQTLRATIAWSDNLLSDAEKALFRRFAVFGSRATLDAVEVVCDVEGDLGIGVIDGMAALVDKSLLRQGSAGAGEPRFTMLETIREYAHERLQQSRDADIVLRRHAAYFLQLAERAEPELNGPHQMEWLERLEREHGNLRAALQWSLDAGAGDTAMRLAGALGWFWYLHSHLVEGRAWLGQILRQSGQAPSAARSKALAADGTLAHAQGDYAEADRLHQEALGQAREVQDRQRVAASLHRVGIQLMIHGQYEQACKTLEESAGLFRHIGDATGLANALNVLGEVARIQHDYDAAQTYYADALTLGRQVGNSILCAGVLHNLGHVALCRTDDVLAADCFRDGLALAQETMFEPMLIFCLAGCAAVSEVRGHAARAVRLFGASEAWVTATHFELEPADRTAYDHHLAAARAQLDDAAFAQAWAEGRAMTMEQAIAYALADAYALA